MKVLGFGVVVLGLLAGVAFGGHCHCYHYGSYGGCGPGGSAPGYYGPHTSAPALGPSGCNGCHGGGGNGNGDAGTGTGTGGTGTDTSTAPAAPSARAPRSRWVEERLAEFRRRLDQVDFEAMKAFKDGESPQLAR